MNKNCFWNLIDNALKNAENGELSISFSYFGYVNKETQDTVEIDYTSLGISFEHLILLLETFASEDKIELVNTENMGYFIYRRQ